MARKKRRVSRGSTDSEILVANGQIVSVSFNGDSKSFPNSAKIGDSLGTYMRDRGLTNFRAKDQNGRPIKKGMINKSFRSAKITSVDINQVDKAGLL